MDMQDTIFCNFVTSKTSFYVDHVCIHISNLFCIFFIWHVLENKIDKNVFEICLNVWVHDFFYIVHS
jgi:hypothetical protein